MKRRFFCILLIILILANGVSAFSYAARFCWSLPQNHWNIAFYIITDNKSTLHRPALHDDIVYHGTIPDDYVLAIKDRAHRFAEGLYTMSNGNIKANIVLYIREEQVSIIETEETSIQDIFTDKSFFSLIDDTNRYDYIMIIHGDAYYGAGAYLQTLNNAVGTHIGFAMFYPHWLDATYSGNPNNVTPGDLLPVDMFGITWDFFTYLLLHEFLHALEDKARLIDVAFPLIHNDNGWYWERLFVGIGMGYGGADYLWSTEQRLPYYYAIMNGIVPTRADPYVKWGFTPQVFMRDRTHTPKRHCVPGEWSVVAATETSYGKHYLMCIVCGYVLESISIPPYGYEIEAALSEMHDSQNLFANIYVYIVGGIVVLGVVVIVVLKVKKKFI